MPAPLFKRFAANTAGRDFVVGDIHGYFYLFEALLAHVGFDEEHDRVFSVGDLVDRGPESERVSEFLLKPWFHAIRGNHEWLLLRGAHTVEWAPQDPAATRDWLANAGSWFFIESLPDQAAIYHDVQQLPSAIEIELAGGGLAGLVHADVVDDSWAATRALLTDLPSPGLGDRMQALLWDRRRAFDAQAVLGGNPRLEAADLVVADVDLVYFGHTPMPSPVALANGRWVDTSPPVGAGLSLAELGPEGRVWTMSEDCLAVTEGWNRSENG